jgi:hypothetical protein
MQSLHDRVFAALQWRLFRFAARGSMVVMADAMRGREYDRLVREAYRQRSFGKHWNHGNEHRDLIGTTDRKQPIQRWRWGDRIVIPQPELSLPPGSAPMRELLPDGCPRLAGALNTHAGFSCCAARA